LTTGRYSTPAFLGWTALTILVGSRFRLGKLGYFALIIPLLLFPTQLRALHYDHSLNFEKMVAALALEMAVNDGDQLMTVHSSPDIVLMQSYYPRKFDYSIFANPLIHNVNELMGQVVNEPSCLAQDLSETKLPDDAHFVRVDGHLTQEGPNQLVLTNREGKAIGYVLTRRTRFKGYVMADAGVFELRDKECAVR